MTPFHTRSELIHYARKRVGSSACRRAFETGTVEVLGAFFPLPPLTNHPGGWILRVRSVNEREWLIAVMALYELHDGCVFREIDNVPWHSWIGRINRGAYHVNDGDNPCHNAQMKGDTDAEAPEPD